jgi:hypothetical protein
VAPSAERPAPDRRSPGRTLRRAGGPSLLAVAAAVASGALAGCASTQQKSERAEVIASRTLLGRQQLRVTRRDPRVEVRSVETVRDAHRVAFVVRLRNRGAEPVNDLPVGVGTRTPEGRRRLLNGRAGLPYWQTHGPAIAPGATATLVVVAETERRLRGRPFAVVGRADRRPTVATALPAVAVAAHPAPADGSGSGGRRSTVAVDVRNRSDVPQYGLELYAVARRGGRLVAAGRVPLAHLGSHDRATADVPLVGDARGARVLLSTSPTLFS